MNNEWLTIVQILTPIVLSTITTVLTLKWVIRKTQNDAEASGANAVKTFGETTNLVGQQNIQLRRDNIELQSENAKLREDLQDMQTLKEEVVNLTQRVEKLEDWAKRLSNQVYELGGIPEPMGE